MRLCGSARAGLVMFALVANHLVASTSCRAQAAVGDLVVTNEDRRTVLKHADLLLLPRHQLTIQEDTGAASTVSGISLWDVLQKAGIPAQHASGRQRAVMVIRLTGADGQHAAVALVEVDPGFSERQALIVDRRDGGPLDTVEGPWRVILPDDQRHARWIRGLVSITVETLR